MAETQNPPPLQKTSDTDAIIAHLAAHASEENKAGMARFGIRTDKAFGVPNGVLRPLARQLGKDHERALQLWQTGWREARLLAAFTDEAKEVTGAQAHRWAGDFNSWDLVDGVADLFVKAGLMDELVPAFAADKREFVRRAGFVVLVSGAVHLKKRPDGDFVAYLPLIEEHASDPRNFVKKAVNWALRQIGKRSLACHGPALALARELAGSTDPARRWIGRDAERELASDKVLSRLQAKAARAPVS